MCSDKGLVRVRTAVAECLDLELDEVFEESRLIKDLGADSLDFVDLVFSLEEEFEIKLRHADFDFLAHLDVTNPEVAQDGFITPEAITKLKEFMPQLTDEDVEGVSISHMFSLITVETLWLVVQKRINLGE